MKPKPKPHKGSALFRVKKFFPQVERVRDSNKTITVNVRPVDARSGRRKDPAGCAMARAAVREKIADGAIIGMAFSWLVKGSTATRFKTSVAVGREITSFDRHQEFAAGRDYKLSRISRSHRMGQDHRGRTGPHGNHKPDPRQIHRTADVRVLR